MNTIEINSTAAKSARIINVGNSGTVGVGEGDDDVDDVLVGAVVGVAVGVVDVDEVVDPVA